MNQQREAINTIKEWLLNKNNKSNPFFLLLGRAGTGKTYSMKILAEECSKESFLFTAPTNKATAQLEMVVGKEICKTTHSALGLQLAYSEDRELVNTGSQVAELKRISCLIVDECSMVDQAKVGDPLKLLDYLEQLALKYKFKVLFMGDEYQLPPVKSETGHSPVFKINMPNYELTQVRRHGGDIFGFCEKVRAGLMRKDFVFRRHPKFPLKTLQIEVLKENLDNFMSGKAKIIAWRNKTVDAYNKLIRILQFGKEVPELVVGDQLIFTQPLFSWNETFPTPFGDILHATDPDMDTSFWEFADKGCFRLMASIDTSAEVSEIEEIVLYSIPCFKVKLKVEGKEDMTGFFLGVKGRRQLKLKADRLRKAAIVEKSARAWKIYYRFTQCFMQIKFSYALTAHRSQGSTFENVFVNLPDILSNYQKFEALKCAYVAISRASKKLHLIK